MIRYLRVLCGFIVSTGLCTLPAVALDGDISPDLESVQSVFCLNSTTGESVAATVMTDANGLHSFDCGQLTGEEGNTISILIQGTLAPTTPPQTETCADVFEGGMTVEALSCTANVPDNNLGTAQTGLIGDVFTFQATPGASGTVTVDTTDRGDGRSNLAPAMVLLAPDGTPIEGSIDEVPCTFPPACGGGCPQLSGTLDLPGQYQLIILDTPAIGPGCTGGDYRIMTTKTQGLTFVSFDDDMITDVTQDPLLPARSR